MTLPSRVVLSSQCWRAGSTVLWGVRCLWPLQWAADPTSLWGTAGSPRRTCAPAGRPPTTPLSRLRAAWRPRAAEAASIWRSTLPSGVHSMRREAEWEASRWFPCNFRLVRLNIVWGGVTSSSDVLCHVSLVFLSSDVPAWLKSLRLHKYAGLFSTMTYDEMMSLTEHQLEAQVCVYHLLWVAKDRDQSLSHLNKQ